MPPATQQAEAPPAAPPASAKTGFLSPTALAVVFALFVIEGVAVFFLSRTFSGEKSKATIIEQKYMEVDLGSHNRPIPVGDKEVILQEVFMVHVVLVLNPVFDNMEELKKIVEERKNLLKNEVNEIIYSKRKDYFYAENVLHVLQIEIKQRLNQLLGTKDGQDVIEKVLFPESSMPSHR